MKHIFFALFIGASSLAIAPDLTAQSTSQLKEAFSASTVHFANNMAFSKDGDYLVLVVGFNADVFQKKDNGFQFMQTLKGGRWQCYNAGISFDGTYIAFSNYEDTYVFKRTADNYSLFQTIRHPGKSENKDLIMRFDGNEKLTIIGGEGNIRFYELSGNSFVELRHIHNKDNLVFQNAALSPNGKVMAIIDVNGDVYCWQLTVDNATKGSVLLKTNKYTGILDVTDDMLLAVGETDSLNLYQVSKDCNSINRLFQFPKGKFGAVNFNPDGNRLMVADQNNQLMLYTIINNLVMLESINSAGSNFTSFKMSEDGKWLAASSSGGKMIKIFEAPTRIAVTKNALSKEKIGAKPTAKNTKPNVVAKAAVKSNSMNGIAVPFRKTNGKYLMVDSASGKPISETEYDEVSKLKNGMLGIFQKGRYGIAKKTGQFLINPDTSKLRFINDEVDKAGNYFGWLYDAKRKGQLGDMVLFNKQYVQITSRAYEFIVTFNTIEEGFYRTSNLTEPDLEKKLWGLLNKDGKEIVKQEYKYLLVSPENRLIMVQRRAGDSDVQGLYDYNGKSILPELYSDISGWDSPAGQKNMIITKEGLTGIVDKRGKIIVPLKYSSLTYVDEGPNSYYSVTINGKKGTLDLSGKEIIAPQYDNLFSMFDEGCNFFYCSKDGKYGWIDRTGKIMLPLIYLDGAGCPGKEGLSWALTSDNDYVFINKMGQRVFGKSFKSVNGFVNGITYVKENDKYGFINIKGIYIVPPTFDKVSRFSDDGTDDYSPILYSVNKENKWGFIDLTGKPVTPVQFDDPGDDNDGYLMSEGLIAVSLNNKWGYIDKMGKMVIPAEYDEAAAFSKGKAIVILNGKKIIIDKTGKPTNESTNH